MSSPAISSQTRVAFLGLGLMGTGMARRILEAGFPLTVYNRNSAKADALVKDGAKAAATPRETAAGADVIISMVADDDASTAAWLGNDGAIAGAKKGALLIESSTVSPGQIRAIAAAAASAGCELIDAPVTGSKPNAAAGQLVFLVGGSPSALDTARPVLEKMSRSIVHLGPLGSGVMVKLINNFVCGVQVASLAEAIAFIERSGLDRDKALAVLTDGAPGSPMVKIIAGRMTAGEYTPNFMLKLMAKDLAYAIKEADAVSLPLATADASLAVMRTAITAGHGQQDLSSVIETLRKAK